MTLVDDETMELSIRSLGSMKVTSVLQDRLSQHQQHVSDLATALLAGGHSRERARQATEIIMDSFRHELTATLEALMETPNAR